MKKSRFTETQIINILKESENGLPVAEICRKHGMSEATFYKWRAKYGGMDVSLMKQFKALEEENRRLKKMYAQERLKADILQEAIEKKVVKSCQRKVLAQRAVSERHISIRTTYCYFKISETCYRYKSVLSTDNVIIACELIHLTNEHRTWHLVYVFCTGVMCKVINIIISEFIVFTASLH